MIDGQSQPTSRPTSLFSTASFSSVSSSSYQSIRSLPHQAILTKVPFPSSSSASPLLPSPTPRSGERDIISPRHALMRSRRVSSPAKLIHSTVQTIVGAGSYSGDGSGASSNRISMASFNSCDSLPEEGLELENDEQVSLPPSSPPPPAMRNRTPSRPKLNRRSASPQSSQRPQPHQRFSLPPPSSSSSSNLLYQPFVLHPGRASSPLGRPSSDQWPKTGVDEGVMEEERKRKLEKRNSRDLEKGKREERRWNIAIELRETEKSYNTVLKEIDFHFYQPLLAALPADQHRHKSAPPSEPTTPLLTPALLSTPISSFNPFDRTRSTTSDTLLSTLTSSSNSSSSTLIQIPVLTKREINEIFSNFHDVLNLSNVILTTLESVVPDKPSKSIPMMTKTKGEISKGLVTPELSSSSDTLSSESGPGTPVEGVDRQEEIVGGDVKRTTSGRKVGSQAPPLALGKALLPILPFLKSYSLFISNFSSSLSLLSSLEPPSSSFSSNLISDDDKSPWNKFCEERKKEGVGKGLGLGGMLLNIVQRIPRYRYLLEDLIRFTERDHGDAKDLKVAFEIVDGVATHLESQIHSHTHNLQLVDLQRSFTNLDQPLLSPGRKLLKSGNLRKLDRRGKEQTGTFFLFTDILIHASENEGWLGLVGGGEEGTRKSYASVGSLGGGGGTAGQFRFHRRFELEDVTVLSAEDSLEEEPKRYTFEVRSPEKSFALFAATPAEKSDWLSAIRDAKATLMQDRRTLQRHIDSEEHLQQRRDRRISLPAALAQRQYPSIHHASLPPPPRLDFIPATPSAELFDQELTESPATFVEDGQFSNEQEATFPSDLSNSLDETATESLQRLSDSANVESNAEAPEIEYRVIENYSAPVWVPDSKADRCMRCNETFGVWRRRHHCRICGSVVCWACSTKTFLIPSNDDIGPDRLARSCDSCYESAFGEPPPRTHHLAPQPTSSSFEEELEEEHQLSLSPPDTNLTRPSKAVTPSAVEHLSNLLGRSSS